MAEWITGNALLKRQRTFESGRGNMLLFIGVTIGVFVGIEVVGYILTKAYRKRNF